MQIHSVARWSSWFVLCALSSRAVFAQDAAPAKQEPAPQPAPPPRATGAAPSDDSFRFGSPAALQEGLTEEMMWPAATAEGWAKPCLVPWQRSFDDALKVSKATGAPILVCVNMDGEIASEHFAGVRYRDPATAKALEPYVCVIASVYRHMPRDYDEQGRRVVCPRFGTVTCSEHMTAESELYAKYFEGLRVSPRHIMLELDGRESYDVYYSWDTATVFTAFAKGVEGRPAPLELARDGVPLPELTKRADARDRAAIEKAYLEGDHEQRATLLRATLKNREVDQNDLLRLAVFGLDIELARIARQSLAQNQTEGAVDLMAEALKVPLEASDRDMLVAAAERLGEKFPRARTLAALHKGLALNSTWIDANAATNTTASAAEYAASIDRRGDAAQTRPDDAAAKLEYAEALFARASQGGDPRFVKTWLEDARRSADEASKLGLAGWRTDALLAAIADRAGESNRALELAVKAVERGMLSADATEARATDLVHVRVLALFAQSRQAAIRKAYRANETWPPEWLADVNAAYAVLSQHALVNDVNLVSYYDFLRWLGGTRRSNAVLDEALRRFPDSALLHDRLRARLLWEGGPEALASDYAKRVDELGASPQLTWFGGYATLVAAEHFRRRNAFDDALAAYGHGIAYFERNIASLPEGKDNCDHYIALAHAGRARIATERGDLATATSELLAAFTRRPDSAASQDGLSLTPVNTAKLLQTKLAEAHDEARGAELQAALAALDPRLLEPPPSETQFPAQRGNRPPRGAGTNR